MELSKLCGGDLDLPIQVAVFDYESSGKHVSMGVFETSVKGLQQAAASGTAMHLKQKGKDVGILTVVRAEVEGVKDISERMAAASISDRGAIPYNPATVTPVPVPSASAFVSSTGDANFVDYVSGGCELNVVVAIDFTGSNGDPRKPGTLHYLHAGGRNDYEKAIAAIVSILAKYDSDQKFPVLGFGAKYNGYVRHCFQCGPTEEAHGVQGVLDAYHSVFQSGLIMSGPTVFTEVIETAAARAQSSLDDALRKGLQSYTILLILTDGAVTNVQETATSLDRISDKPISVVVVGVGNADFGAMQFLDDAAKPGKRDIAQFVQFNKHSHNSVALTTETLHEIPEQLVGFFQTHNIAPLPQLVRSDSEIIVEPEDEEIDLSLNIQDEEIVVTGGGSDFVDGFAASR